MKRYLSNFLTVVIAAAVLIAGALYAQYLLPRMTDNNEKTVLDCNVKLTNPQEIIEQPSAAVDPVQEFPGIFAKRVPLAKEQWNEQTIQSRKTFLNSVSEAVDILFNIKIDGIIMEKHTQIWRREEDDGQKFQQPAEGGMIQEGAQSGMPGQFGAGDVFSVDVLFTDARATRWRITAYGYAGSVFHLSCMESTAGLFSQPNPVQNQSYLDTESTVKLDSAINRFRSKLYSLPEMSAATQSKDLVEYNRAMRGEQNGVLWVVNFQYDNCYLVSGFLQESMTPVSYTFVNFAEQTGNDYIREFLDRQSNNG